MENSRLKGLLFTADWTRDFSEIVREAEIPADLLEKAKEKRATMIELLAEADEEICDLFVMEEEITTETLMVCSMSAVNVVSRQLLS